MMMRLCWSMWVVLRNVRATAWHGKAACQAGPDITGGVHMLPLSQGKSLQQACMAEGNLLHLEEQGSALLWAQRRGIPCGAQPLCQSD